MSLIIFLSCLHIDFFNMFCKFLGTYYLTNQCTFVFRVFASILLLGNVEFVSGPSSEGKEDSQEGGVAGGGYDVEIIGRDELNSVAALLGVSATSLLQGLTSRTHAVRPGQPPVRSMSDAKTCNATRYNFPEIGVT